MNKDDQQLIATELETIAERVRELSPSKIFNDIAEEKRYQLCKELFDVMIQIMTV